MAERRRGMALLTVLWLLVVAGTVAAAALATARRGSATTRNRIALVRAEWARNACAEILLARYAGDPLLTVIDTVDLGRGTWCRASLEDADARLDVNTADAAALARVIGNDSLAAALLDWRDPDDLPHPLGAEAEWYRSAGRRPPRNAALASLDELRLVRGFTPEVTSRLESLLTVRGSGRVNLNGGVPEVVATLPGIGPEAIRILDDRRQVGRAIAGTEELLALLSPAARDDLRTSHLSLSPNVVYSPVRYIAQVEGGVRGLPLRSRGVLTLVPAAGRLAVIRQEME